MQHVHESSTMRFCRAFVNLAYLYHDGVDYDYTIFILAYTRNANEPLYLSVRAFV